jgi:Rhodopirellula transposase DDE domain
MWIAATMDPVPQRDSGRTVGTADEPMKRSIIATAILVTGMFGAGIAVGQIGGIPGSSAASAIVTTTTTQAAPDQGGHQDGAQDAPHADGTVTAINWRARPLTSMETVIALISSTTTAGGLTVTAVVDTNRYPTKIRISNKELKSLHLVRETIHGDWNYALHSQVNDYVV